MRPVDAALGLVLAGPAAGPRVLVGAALDGAWKTADRAVAAGGERMRRQPVLGGVAAEFKVQEFNVGWTSIEVIIRLNRELLYF